MLSIQIKNSYKIWRPKTMKKLILQATKEKYDISFPCALLNRTYLNMYIEWYLHNIGFWFTYPFTEYDWIAKLNRRFQHVDLEEHRR